MVASSKRHMGKLLHSIHKHDEITRDIQRTSKHNLAMLLKLGYGVLNKTQIDLGTECRSVEHDTNRVLDSTF